MPSISNLRAPDKYLTNFSLKIAQDQRQFKAANSLPKINVEQQSGIYRIYDSENLRKVQVRPLASGTQTTAGDFDYGRGNYYAELRGLHVDLDPVLRANATDIDLEKDATQHLTTQMMLERENRFYDTYMVSGAWDRDMSGVASAPTADQFVHFDDASSDPVTVIQDAMLSQQIASGGFLPNTGFMGRRVFNELLRHPDVLDRIRYRGGDTPAIANEQSLAAIFGLDRIVVLETVVGGDTGNRMLGDNQILLAYVNGSAGQRSVTAMAAFNWVGLGRYMTLGNSIVKFDHPLLDGVTRLEIKYADQFAVVAPSLGTLLSGVLSS